MYQLVAVGGHEMNLTSTSPILTLDAKVPPILVNPDQLGGPEAAGQIFTMGVRLKTEQVCF